jgi:hypothetical protein
MSTLVFPRYKCHKEVGALKIGEGVTINPDGSAVLHFQHSSFDPITVAREVVSRHLPMPGDYLVQYEDGYLSISPGKVFEEGYTRI